MTKSLLMLFVLHILNDGYRTTIITLLPFIAAELSLSLTQVGFLGSSQSMIGTLLAIPSGYFAARFGGFRVLIICLLLYAAGFFGIAAAPFFSTLLPAFYLTAIGFAFFHPVSFALVTRLSDPKVRGKNMGNFMSLGDIGRLTVPAVALFFAPFFGWRVVVAIAAVIGFGIFVVSKILLRDNARTKPTDTVIGRKRDWLKDAMRMLKVGPFRIALLSAIGDSLASSSIYTFLPFLLLARGVGATQLLIFTSVYFLGTLSGKTLLGRGVDKYGNKKMFILSEIGMAITLFLLVATRNFFILVILSYLVGLFTRGTSPVVQTMLSDATHEAHYEKAFGASEMFIQIAGATSVLVSGIVADHFGVSIVFYLAAILALFATIPILSSKYIYK